MYACSLGSCPSSGPNCMRFVFLLFRFSPEAASRRGLSTAEMNAVEAIHRAVEFNPHVPKVSLRVPWELIMTAEKAFANHNALSPGTLVIKQ